MSGGPLAPEFDTCSWCPGHARTKPDPGHAHREGRLERHGHLAIGEQLLPVRRGVPDGLQARVGRNIDVDHETGVGPPQLEIGVSVVRRPCTFSSMADRPEPDGRSRSAPILASGFFHFCQPSCCPSPWFWAYHFGGRAVLLLAGLWVPSVFAVVDLVGKTRATSCLASVALSSSSISCEIRGPDSSFLCSHNQSCK